MLYLVSTPIGNLKDITLRAIEVLKSVDYILCEDTRHSKILLDRYAIEKPLKSFHKFNEKMTEDQVIEDLKNGKTIALVSDAGTPLICDPGSRIVQRCNQEKLDISTIPGPCSVVAALTLCPYEYDQFQFIGFLPKTQTTLIELLEEALFYKGITLCFESPERIIKTLKTLIEINPLAEIGAVRELTKIHEESIFGVAEELVKHFEIHPPKGEFVLILRGNNTSMAITSLEEAESLARWFIEKESCSIKEAINKVGTIKKIDKKALYKKLHNL